MKKEPLQKGTLKKDFRKQNQQPKKQLKINRYSDVVGLAIIILLGIVIYSNSFNCSFQFDDLPDIVNNTKIHNLADVKTWLNYSGDRPLGIFTFVLNYHFNQIDVRYYHLVNLIIHLISACLVWWLTILIFSSPVLKDHPIIKHKKVVAFLTALLFVSHPLATQSVTYIVQRLASLVAMFYLLSLALYVKARLTNNSNTSKYLLFAGSFISAVAAMLTKENAFTLPFAIVLFELFFFRTKKLSINFKDYRVILLLVAFLGVIIIIPLKFSFSIFNPIAPTQGNTYTITWLNYLFTEFSVILKYIQLLFLPVNQNLDYDFSISNSFFEIKTLLSFLVLLALIILAIFLYKKYRIISFGIAWFFLTLAIESSIIPIPNVIFEHRTYLPSFGFFLAISTVIYVLFWNKYKFLAISIFAIIIGSNSFLTYERNKVWKNDLSLWSDIALKSPNKARAFINRGSIYLNLGQLDKALADYSRALEINPKHAMSYCNRGIVYDNLGQWNKSIVDYSSAIEIDPKSRDAFFKRGIDYGNLGQWNKAISDYSSAIEIDTKYASAYCNRGIAYGNLGQWDKALADYLKAIEIDPKHTETYYNRGIAFENLKQWDKAINDFSKAIEIDPKFVRAYNNRGIDYGNLSQWDTAINDYSKVIEIDPNYSKAYSNRGFAFGNLGQWDKALADYSKAIEIDPKFAIAYLNRGGAYSNLGQWDKAITDYTKAIEIDPNYTVAYSNRDVAYAKSGIKK